MVGWLVSSEGGLILKMVFLFTQGFPYKLLQVCLKKQNIIDLLGLAQLHIKELCRLADVSLQTKQLGKMYDIAFKMSKCFFTYIDIFEHLMNLSI